MKKIEKMSLIYELSISKLGYTDIFMKISGEKVLTYFLGTFLNSRGKNEDEDEKTWQNDQN